MRGTIVSFVGVTKEECLSTANILGNCRYTVLDTAECGIYPPMVPFYNFCSLILTTIPTCLEVVRLLVQSVSPILQMSERASKIRRGAVG